MRRTSSSRPYLVEADGKGLKPTANAANGDGAVVDLMFSCTLDGTTCKQVSSLPFRGSVATDAITLKRVEERTIPATGTKAGALVYEDRRVVSADSNTMTLCRQGVMPDGQKYQSTIVLVRSK
jgi:hypothetical protein